MYLCGVSLCWFCFAVLFFCYFCFICTGVQIHPEFETAEALAIACIVEFFLDISPSLHYLSFLILISIQYIPFHPCLRRNKRLSIPYCCSLGLTCIRCHMRIFLWSEIEVRHVNFQGKLDPISKGSSVELYTLTRVSSRVYELSHLQGNPVLRTNGIQVQHRYTVQIRVLPWSHFFILFSLII